MKTVLLIDDSKPQLLNAKFTLQHGGYLVETVSDPMTALERIKEVQPDLIITDINMPGKDGITLVRDIRQLPEFSTTPLLIISTDSQQHLFEEARTAGEIGWVKKPVWHVDMLATV